MYILIDFSLYSLIIDEQGFHFQTGANESLFFFKMTLKRPSRRPVGEATRRPVIRQLYCEYVYSTKDEIGMTDLHISGRQVEYAEDR